MSPPTVLDPEQAQDLRQLLGAGQDWLLHTSPEVLHELGGFLAGLGWATPAHATPTPLATRLIDELGAFALILRPPDPANPPDRANPPEKAHRMTDTERPA